MKGMSPRAGDWIEINSNQLGSDFWYVPPCGGLDRNILMTIMILAAVGPPVRGTG